MTETVTITIANEKGGVGKTTLAINLAAYLAMLGYRVVIMDTDVQGSTGLSYDIRPDHSLYDLLVRGKDWRNLLVPVPSERWSDGRQTDGEIFMLPSNDETVAIPLSVKETDVIYDRITELEGYFDYVIIDTPPTGSMLQAAMYYAADSILVPTQLEALSVDALVNTVRRIYDQVQDRKNTDRPLNFLGVQPNMKDGRYASHDHNLNHIKEHFGGLCHTPLTKLAAWADASQRRESIYAYSQNDRATGVRRAIAEFEALMNRIEEGIIIHG
jgi:chromosome partitioning protein